MTGPEGGTPNLDLVEALAAAGMAAGPIENSRRLIPLVTETEGQVLEFYSSQAGSRLLALPRQGVDHEIHDDLSRAGLPVLPRYPDNSSQDLDMLLIPQGTWSLGSRLHIVHRDLRSYSDVFWYVTRSQVAQHEAGLGVMMPVGGLRAIDHFAYAPDMKSESGQQLYLLPPYTVHPDVTPLDFARGLIAELQTSGEFNERQMGYLTDVILQGVAINDER